MLNEGTHGKRASVFAKALGPLVASHLHAVLLTPHHLQESAACGRTPTPGCLQLVSQTCGRVGMNVHPQLPLAVVQVFLTPHYLAIVMEFAAGGDMFEYVIKNKSTEPGQGLSEKTARW